MEFFVHEFLKRLHRLHPAKSCEILVNPATTHWCETAISFRPALPLPVWARGHHLSQTLVSPRSGFRRLTAETRLSPDGLANYVFLLIQCQLSSPSQDLGVYGGRGQRRFPIPGDATKGWRLQNVTIDPQTLIPLFCEASPFFDAVFRLQIWPTQIVPTFRRSSRATPSRNKHAPLILQRTPVQSNPSIQLWASLGNAHGCFFGLRLESTKNNKRIIGFCLVLRRFADVYSNLMVTIALPSPLA